MAVWLARAGKDGEHEERFMSENRIFCNWNRIQDLDLKTVKTAEDIKMILRNYNPQDPERRIGNWASQIYAFVANMQIGELVVVPRHGKGSVAIGEITSAHQYDAKGPEMYRHFRTVRWLNQSLPRTAFEPDLLHSFSGLMSIYQIHAEDPEKRIKTVVGSGGRASKETADAKTGEGEDVATGSDEIYDLEQDGYDQIARMIIRKYKGDRMELLVAAILKAQGYLTFQSPRGRDKGVDLLAAPGPLGFGHPRICVQVKATEGPVDRPTLDQLIGTMHNVGAEQGLLVSWGGFTAAVDGVVAQHFFKVRVWDQRRLIEELLSSYAKLDEEIRAELPLKQIWALAGVEE